MIMIIAKELPGRTCLSKAILLIQSCKKPANATVPGAKKKFRCYTAEPY